MPAKFESVNTAAANHEEVLDEVLVEEVSIDGMCGVY
ncbi:mycofactocin precursor MftA [Carbonactinospora thermoautotrophica]|nr:mycofactocin precursor MftA [Carbonactinospora thermoautotrophica]